MSDAFMIFWLIFWGIVALVSCGVIWYRSRPARDTDDETGEPQ